MMKKIVELERLCGPLDAAKQEALREVLRGLDRFAPHHPYMRRVVVLGEEGDVTRYAIEEEHRVLGAFALHPRYEVESWEEAGQVRWRATVQGLLRLNFYWSLPALGQTSALVERAEIQGPWPATEVFARVMRPAHEAALASIARELEL